ncbi:MAG: hypothetical protein H7Z18_00280, partial [Methylophilaceae bacterium]|nr:hypothetical protein [Methylophilaceae bacterium]
AFENEPKIPQRFLIASLPVGLNSGGFPSHDVADLYVQQLRLHGYNMARIDFVEAVLMEGRKADFDYNPEQLDRFYYLVSALKNNGIYLILNGLSSDNGGYGNISERWIGKMQLHQSIYFDIEKQAHWKKLITTMYGNTNSYTGMSLLKDPVMAGLILVNEGNLVFVNRQGVLPAFKPTFAKWLKAKYGSNQALKVAWGKELNAGENLDTGLIEFPAIDAWTSKRMADVQQFYFETEKKTTDWMTQYARQQGYQGLVTNYNLWHAPAAQATRGQLQWVDMHNYFGHPEYTGGQEMTVRQDSMLADSAGYYRELASAKHIGKPFTVTEHGQIFWNPYRRENGLVLPAYAAFQNWSGICQHSGAIALSYVGVAGRKTNIEPFAVAYDPIARASETLAALLYLRGDVTPAKHTLGVKFGPVDAFEKSAHLGNTPSDISKLSLVTGVGLDWQGQALNKSKQVAYDGQVDFNQKGFALINNGVKQNDTSKDSLGVKLDGLLKKYTGNLAYKINKVGVIADERWSARLQNLRDAHWLNDTNLTSAESGIYQSDTNELTLDSAQKRMVVITPKTEAVVFDKLESIQLKQLKVLEADSASLVAVSAMDDQTLQNSKRMLVVLATDARNSGMRFADSAETKLTSMGSNPVMIKTTKIKLSLQNSNAKNLKVFSTNLRGQRQDAIPVALTSPIQKNDSIEFTLDTSTLSHGPTTYFEISL